ncbi:hypothetical protein [Streptomyces sp. Amel2xB2]|uniref:hypothetical protein n=1 Tax=Streptomyces sp. Amel2xB2 TaxID=1305829 RepID=UPI000DB966BE|nr:hypothetical protein [Streptomyces sp. Amel2xB2]
MRERTGREGGPDQGEHRVSTGESGAFSYARCVCGWRGPARRARESARADGNAHLARQDGDDGADTAGPSH